MTPSLRGAIDPPLNLCDRRSPLCLAGQLAREEETAECQVIAHHQHTMNMLNTDDGRHNWKYTKAALFFSLMMAASTSVTGRKCICLTPPYKIQLVQMKRRRLQPQLVLCLLMWRWGQHQRCILFIISAAPNKASASVTDSRSDIIERRCVKPEYTDASDVCFCWCLFRLIPLFCSRCLAHYSTVAQA